jgi:hypothetical protein
MDAQLIDVSNSFPMGKVFVRMSVGDPVNFRHRVRANVCLLLNSEEVVVDTLLKGSRAHRGSHRQILHGSSGLSLEPEPRLSNGLVVSPCWLLRGLSMVACTCRLGTQ